MSKGYTSKTWREEHPQDMEVGESNGPAAGAEWAARRMAPNQVIGLNRDDIMQGLVSSTKNFFILV